LRKDSSFYKKLYSEILLGYSSVVLKDRVFYLKHIDNLDSLEQSEAYAVNFEYAKSKGLQQKKEKLDFIIANNIWTKEKENKISSLEDSLERLHATQKKLFVQAQRNQNQKEIDKLTLEFSLLNSERFEALGETCETFANKKSQEAMIRSLFFKDEGLQEKLYTKEEFDDLDHSEISTLFVLMGKALAEFTEKNIRILSLCPLFLNSFFLCSDSAYNFYGKAVSLLSNNQISLYSNGITVKDYASKGHPLPDNILDDPEKALSWFSFDPDAKNKISDKDGGTIVGATIEEMKRADPNAKSIGQMAKDKFKGKKQLNMQDMLNLHGYEV